MLKLLVCSREDSDEVVSIHVEAKVPVVGNFTTKEKTDPDT